LDVEVATKLVVGQVSAIKKYWKPVCDQAALSEVDRNFMWRRQFLNPFAFVDTPLAIAELAD
jgi:serine/threonine-protein kinase HipA